MKRHPGNILARPSLIEIVFFYALKNFGRVRVFMPALMRRNVKRWILAPQGGLHRMITALLLGFRVIHTYLSRVLSKPWRVPALPIYAAAGSLVALTLVITRAQWPAPVTPLDIDGLLLSQVDTSQNFIAWSNDNAEDNPVSAMDIPSELYPETEIAVDSQVIASLDFPVNNPTRGLDDGELIASISLTNHNSLDNKVSARQFPPVNGIYHVIRRGETLWDIAKAYSVECDQIEGYNPHINPRRMQMGEKIFIPGADNVVVIPQKTQMILPINNAWVISGFGMRKHPLGGVLRYHRGIDLPTDIGTPVRAVMEGVVTELGWRGTLGKYVMIEHSGGFETVYAHNSVIEVKVGEHVKEGRIISRSGSSGRSTGPHLHFEVIKNGKHVDPEQFLPRLSRTRPRTQYASDN
jgi:hypothetical protein